MSLFGLFGKKKFGLAEALVVVDKKPNITPDGAKTGAAFVEALGLPVTVVPETETNISTLEASLAEMQEGIKSAKTELNVIPTYAGGAIDTFKVELEKLRGAIREAVRGKINRIEDARNSEITNLDAQIRDVKYKAGIKSNRALTRGETKTSKITKKIDEKIVEVEAQLKSDLTNLKTRITDLEAETKSAKAEISSLTKIKALFA